jgi:flavin-dependent dehydrogenase
MKAIENDVLIIGAGPAGVTAAAHLLREGFHPLVVEKERFPRFVIGESLLPHTMDLLKAVDLLDVVEQQGYMHKNGAVFRRGNQVCEFDFANQSAGGWNYTFQVPRDGFDKVLADAVAARGVEILYGHGVSAVNFVNAHAEVTLDLPGGGRRQVATRFVLDCSGYGRVLPRLLDLEAPSTLPVRESLFTHVTGDHRPAARDEGKIWICIHPGDAWIWIIPFSDGRTSLGVVARPEFYQRFPGAPEAQLRAIVMSDPNAAARLADMKLVFPPQRITGYSCGIKRLFGPRYALTGNATEFLDPVFSSGVTLAMASALRAAQVLGRELRGEPVDWQTEYADYLAQGVTTFRAYIDAWYDQKLPTILFAAQRNPDVMRQICSVLAGYVWDQANPYVTQAGRALQALATIAGGGKPRPAV